MLGWPEVIHSERVVNFPLPAQQPFRNTGESDGLEVGRKAKAGHWLCSVEAG